MMARAALVLLALGALSCSVAGVPTSAGADVLWLPGEAVLKPDAAYPVVVVNGRSIYKSGSAAVSFAVEADPNALVRRLTTHFAAHGWQERLNQQLNPHLETSFKTGFTPAGGGVFSPGQTEQLPYLRWHGEWQSPSGEAVLYSLGAQGTRIQGYASYAPSRRAVAVR